MQSIHSDPQSLLPFLASGGPPWIHGRRLTCFGFIALFSSFGRREVLGLLLQQPFLELWQVNEAMEVMKQFGLDESPRKTWIMERLLSAAASKVKSVAESDGPIITPPNQTPNLYCRDV